MTTRFIKTQLSFVEMYDSINEDGNVAFDIAYVDDRQYFRIGCLGIGRSKRSSDFVNIIGVDIL